MMRTRYLTDTLAVIETAYANSGNTKVTLVGHSYGNVVAQYLLASVPQSWKDKYVAQFMSFSGPYLGVPMSTMVMLTGQYTDAHSGGIHISPAKLANLTKHLGTSHFLLPNPNSPLGSGMLVNIVGENYTALDYPRLWEEVAGPEVAIAYEAVLNSSHPTIPPNVTTYCVNGYGLPTLHQVWFNSTKFNGDLPYKVTHTDGDSVVDRYSLNQCQRWNESQPFPVFSWEIESMVHGTGPFLPQVFHWWMHVVNPLNPINSTNAPPPNTPPPSTFRP